METMGRKTQIYLETEKEEIEQHKGVKNRHRERRIVEVITL